MSSQRLLMAGLLFGAFACTHSFESAQREDTAEAYRRFLRESPGDEAALAARNRLAEIEFQGARREHTVLAYKRFLAEFPGSARAPDAQTLLEGLRFEAARELGSAAAWREFLRDHPAGALAGEARRGLEEADFREAIAAPGSEPIFLFLARYPESARRAEAEAMADDRLFAELSAQGPRGMVAYLERSPAGRHRDPARVLLQSREALALASVGDFNRAHLIAERLSDPGQRAALVEQVGREELEWAAAAVDPRALERVALERGGALGVEARERAAALGRGPGLETLRKLVARLAPAHYARPADELQRVLGASDPRDRWLAAEELGLMGARAAIDPLLDAVAVSRFSRVRQRAFEALRSLFAVLPADAVELHVRDRIESLRKVANSPALHVKLAVLEELTGDRRAAADRYARAQRGDGADLFVLRRLATLRAEEGQDFSAAVAARELAVRVVQLIEQRASDEDPVPVLQARVLCGVRDDARASVALLEALPPAVVRDSPDDLAAFLQRARDAERLASARLADAEAAARSSAREFRGCDDDGELRARMEQGVRDRLGALEELAARGDARALPAVRRTARLDPSARVREAAAMSCGKEP